jgi:oligopeptide transport system permease protein
MLQYLFRKFFYILLVIFIVATLTFIMARAIPGGPFTREKPLPPAVLKNIEARYNLDKPIFVQYLRYMGNMVRFDFGPSFRYEALTVNDIIKQTFPVSAILGSIALFLALFFGIITGTLAALYQHKWQDSSLMVLSLQPFLCIHSE